MPSASDLWQRVRTVMDVSAFFTEELGQELRGTGAERTARCPFHDDHTPSLGVNVETGRWRCRAASCGADGDAIGLYKALHGLSFRDAAEALAGRYIVPVAGATAPHEADALARRNERALNDYAPTPPQPERTIDPDVVQAYHRRLMVQEDRMAYLTDTRGLTRETIERYRIGHDGQRYTIPIPTAAGDVVNIRRYKPGGGPKMLNTRGYGSPARLFPLDALNTAGRIVLCAGEWDCLLARQHGQNAITGTGGEDTWRDEWTPLFAGRDVVIVYDSDEAGRKAARNVAAKLHEAAR